MFSSGHWVRLITVIRIFCPIFEHNLPACSLRSCKDVSIGVERVAILRFSKLTNVVSGGLWIARQEEACPWSLSCIGPDSWPYTLQSPYFELIQGTATIEDVRPSFAAIPLHSSCSSENGQNLSTKHYGGFWLYRVLLTMDVALKQDFLSIEILPDYSLTKNKPSAFNCTSRCNQHTWSILLLYFTTQVSWYACLFMSR